MLTKDKKEKRKFDVLTHIIRLYVGKATPVSSGSVRDLMRRDLSSATIRNIMGELEEEGCIVQPHTSAGRIPTDSGYRKYVDSVKKRLENEKRKAENLAREYTSRIRSIKEIIEKTTFLLSRELHNAGVVMWPCVGDFYLKHLKLIKIRAESMLAVLVTMTNAVKNYVVKVDKDLEDSQLEKISNFINSNYERKNVSLIAKELKELLESKEQEDISKIIRFSLETIDRIIEIDIENEIYWQGLEYFTEGPEFQDIDITRHLIQIFSSKKEIASLLRRELPFVGIKEYIGKENQKESLRECTLITGGYELYGNVIGRIGVIGPTRMDYEKAIRTVKDLSELISIKLEEIS